MYCEDCDRYTAQRAAPNFVDILLPTGRCYVRCRVCGKKWSVDTAEWRLEQEREAHDKRRIAERKSRAKDT